MNHNSTPLDRAAVLGAGMAGLLAARALADHFTEVIVVDRDNIGVDVSLRRGVPQGRHTHALLAHGVDLLDRLFPGLTEELVEEGAPTGDMLADTHLSFGGYRFAQGPSGLRMVSVTRPTLERTVRRRVTAIPGVTLLGGRDVVGLVTEPGALRVRGIRMFDRAEGSAEEQLPADLVVVATGRGSRLPRWLEELGLPHPSQERVEVGVGYTSQRYHIELPRDGALAMVSAPTPHRPRAGALSLVEDGEWLLTLMGVLGDHPPTKDSAMLRFAADLHLPEIHHALAGATPLDEPVTHRHPVSVRRCYHRMPTFPEGLTVVGDAACCLNPVYGQGMTVAAMQATTLHENPHVALGDLARSAQAAWTLAEGADLSFPGVPGRRTPASRMLARYVAGVQAGAAVDPRLGRSFLRVTSLVDPPAALLHPDVLRRLATAPRRPTGEASVNDEPAGPRQPPMGEDAIWQVVHHERSQLADLLETLTPDEWEHPSLCAGWSVRDVAAHVIGAAELTLGRALVDVIRARGSIPRAGHDAATRRSRRPPEQIIEDYRRLNGSRHVVPGTGSRDALVDVLVHFQDIAIPLGRDHRMPLRPAREAAQHAWHSIAFGAQKKLSGFRLEATDTDWTAGHGQEIRGPVQALLLLVTGRPAALPDLHGEGLPALKRRIQATGGWKARRPSPSQRVHLPMP